MTNYDFKQLSPSDFELISRDLLQAEMNITLESFANGKDGGIDFRYTKNSSNLIVQCKHYVNTGLSGLISTLKKETSKVLNLNPNRYILVTSVPLTPKNKSEIASVIGTSILSPNDVIGQDDLNNLLTKHSQIERKHYKLWLASKAVLDRVLHNAVVTHSEFKAEKIYKELPKYVQSNIFPKALKILEVDRTVIIAGAPGVGKTTLANLLLYYHLERGSQAVVIESDIRDAKSLVQKGVDQIFYFDDFFGATFLGENGLSFSSNEDQAFIDFVSMIRTSTSSRLILTTREHILNQALQKSERLRLSDVSDHKLILQISDYSISERARILYNHLYFSDLPVEYKQVLLQGDFYLEIVRHKKFNPRLIEWLSSYRRVKVVSFSNYKQFVKDLLNNPAEIWMHAYENQISDAGRSLLLTIFSYEGKVNPSILESSFKVFHQLRARKYGFTLKPNDYKLAFKELVGAFIKNEKPEIVEVLDPSVLDLLNEITRENPDNIIDLIGGANNFTQIKNIWSFARSTSSGKTLEKIIENSNDLLTTLNIVAFLPRVHITTNGAKVYTGISFEERLSTSIDITDKIKDPKFLDLIKNLHSRLKEEWDKEYVNISAGIEILRTHNGINWADIDDLSELFIDCRDTILSNISYECSSEDLRELIALLDSYELNEEYVSKSLNEAIEKYLQDYFKDELNQLNSSSQFDSLLDDLQTFQSTLGIDTDKEQSLTVETKDQFEENQSRYEDHMQDEWKEQYYDTKHEDNGIRDLFSTLK
jgi:GTPase SAR1 family protein